MNQEEKNMSFVLPPSSNASIRTAILAAAVCGAAALWAHPGLAAASPFARFAGDWTGGGQVIGANGDRERIRCRANYEESQRGEALSQTIICASASYRIDIQSYVEASGETVRGRWEEQTRNISGELTGRIDGGQFEGAVVGPGFTAGISLVSDGRRQAVNIAPSGGDIADVRIELERRG